MLFIYLLLAYGITNIIVYGSIFYKFRELFNTKYTSLIYGLVTCPMCFSTWVGFALSIVLLYFGQVTPISLVFELPNYLTIFLDGCFTSGAVWLIFKMEDKLVS